MDVASTSFRLEDVMSSDDSVTAQKAKPRKRSLVERELETNMTARITSPITNGDTHSTSRYGRARKAKSDNSFEMERKTKSKSPKTDKSPVKSPEPVIKMFASNSPLKSESQTSVTKSPIENRIESIYNETVSLSRFSNEKNPSPKKGKVYIRKDLIQRKEKEQTENIIKNMFSPVKSPYKRSSIHLNNILERSSEKYNLNNDTDTNGYLEKTPVVKMLNFDCKQKTDNVEATKDRSKNEIADLEASCPYDVGDLTWARIGSYPFWPCIITRDPYSDMFVKRRGVGRIERNVVHVTFFGDNGRRGWVPENMLRQYLGQVEFEGTRENFSAEDKKKDPKLYAAFFISEKKQRKWHISVEEAESFLREPKSNRLDMLYDMLIKIRGTKTTPVRDKSTNMARKDSDVSLSETLLDTLFSEDDSKTDDVDRSGSKARKKSIDVSEVVTACLDNMAAKTGIITIKKQSHMDRWLQKAKSKTPEKSQSKNPTNDDKKKTKKDFRTNKPSPRNNLAKKTVQLNKTFPIFNLHELNTKTPNRSLLENGINKVTNKCSRANSFDSVHVVSSSEDESVKNGIYNKIDLNFANEVAEKNSCSEPSNEVVNNEKNSSSIYPKTHNNVLDSTIELTPESIVSNDAEQIHNIQTVNQNDMEITLEVDRVQSPISISNSGSSIQILNVFSIDKVTKNVDIDTVEPDANDKIEYIESGTISEMSTYINKQDLTVDQNELTTNVSESQVKLTNEKSSIKDSELTESKIDNEEKKQIDQMEVDEHTAVTVRDDILINETNDLNVTSESEVIETNEQVLVEKIETNVVDKNIITTGELIVTQIDNKIVPLNKPEPKEVNISTEQKTSDLSDLNMIDKEDIAIVFIAQQDAKIEEKLRKTDEIVTFESDNKTIQIDKLETTDVNNKVVCNSQQKPKVEGYTSRIVEVSEANVEDVVISEFNDFDKNLLQTVAIVTPESDKTIQPDKPVISDVDNEVVHSSEQKTNVENQTFRTTEADILQVNDDDIEDEQYQQTYEIATTQSAIELDKPENIEDEEMYIYEQKTNIHKQTHRTAEVVNNEVQKFGQTVEVSDDTTIGATDYTTPESDDTTIGLDKPGSTELDNEVVYNSERKTQVEGQTVGTAEADISIVNKEVMAISEFNDDIEDEQHQQTYEIATTQSAIELDKPENIEDEEMYIYEQKTNIHKQTHRTAEVVNNEVKKLGQTVEISDDTTIGATDYTSPESDDTTIGLDKPGTTELDNEVVYSSERKTQVEGQTVATAEADISIANKEVMAISEFNAKLDEKLLHTVDLVIRESDDTTVGPDKAEITDVDNEVVHCSEQETKVEDQNFRTAKADISQADDEVMVISELDPKLEESLQAVETVTPTSDGTTFELDKPEITDVDNEFMDISQREAKVEDQTFRTAEADISEVNDENMFADELKSKLDKPYQPSIEITTSKSTIELDKPDIIDIDDEVMFISEQKTNIHKQRHQTAEVVATGSDNQIIDLVNPNFNDSLQVHRTHFAHPRCQPAQDTIIDLDNEIFFDKPAPLKEKLVEVGRPKSADVDDDVVYVTDRDPLETPQINSITVHLEEITADVVEHSVNITDTETAKKVDESDLMTVDDLMPAKLNNLDDVSMCVTDLIDDHTDDLNTMEISNVTPVTDLKLPEKMELNKSDIKVNEIQPEDTDTPSPKRVLRNRSDAEKLPKSDSPVEFNKNYDKFDRSYDDPEFLKYMELSQDALMDEHPHLTRNETVAYLYRTWIFDQDQKSDAVRHDDIQNSNLIKGLEQKPSVVQLKKPKKRIKVDKEPQFIDEAPNREKNTRKKVVKPFYTELYDSDSDSDVYEKDSSGDINPDIANGDVFIDEYDEMNFHIEQLTKTKPNVFKGLVRERLCEICEKPSGLVKCKGLCGGYFHVDCVNREARPAEDQSLLHARKKKKRGRKSKTTDDSDSKINGTDSESQEDKSQDNISTDDQNNSFDKLEYTPHIVTNLDDLETQLATKMKELLDNDQQNTPQYSSDEELDWKDSVPGKCEIVDVKPKRKCDENSEPTGYSDFKCHICSKHETPLCSVCKSALSPKTQSDQRQRCNVAHCQRYYHLDCLDHWPQAHFLEPSRSNKKASENFEALTCPRHVCHTCVSDDPRGCKTRFSSDKLAKCVRCPAVYHSFTKCLPAGSQILNASNIICPRHYEYRPGRVPCHVNTGWCFICALGGTLICCEYCPTSFHAECLNIDPPEGGYMCEDCETGRLPLYGEMVWVKLGHYRWWPGIILHPEDVPDNVRVMKHSQGEFVVRFFGQYDHYWVNRGRVFPFQEGDSGNVSSQKSKIDAAFTKAMEHAQKAYEAFKNAAANEEESQDIQSSLLPPHYVKLKVNKPIGGAVRCKVDVSEANSLTQCECDPKDFDPCGPDSQCLNRMLLTECGPTCRAGDRCNNRSFERRTYPKMVPYRTPQRGWGLKTLEDIKRGQFVIEYVGELIDEEEFRRRMGRKHEIRDENFYFLTLDKDRMIDAGPKGNLARFMNHCCEPNCETQKWTVLGDVRVGLFALHDIKANTEVTFNYNLECAGIEKKQCMCGAKRCSGYIGAKPKQDEKVKTTKRVYNKKRKVASNQQESPGTIRPAKPSKPKITIKIKPRELTEIEKDLLIIKSATNGISSDSESGERVTTTEKDSVISKDRKAMKRKRVSFSTEEVVIYDNGTAAVGVKKVKYDDNVENGPV